MLVVGNLSSACLSILSQSFIENVILFIIGKAVETFLFVTCQTDMTLHNQRFCYVERQKKVLRLEIN